MGLSPRDTTPNLKKLLDPIRERIDLHNDSCHTEQFIAGWTRRFILSPDKLHPRKMKRLEIESFLTYLAVDRNVALSTQNQPVLYNVFS